MEGILLSFLMIFVAIVKYWYISIPIIAVIVIWYKRTSNKVVSKVLRVIIALIAIAVVIGLVLYIFGQ